MLFAERPTVICLKGGLGTFLLTLPGLRALAALFPNRLTLLCQRGLASAFFSGLPLRAIYELDISLLAEGKLASAGALVDSLRATDLLIGLLDGQAALAPRLLELFDSGQSKGTFLPRLLEPRSDVVKHVVDLAFDVPARLDPSLKLDDFVGPPEYPAKIREQAAKLRRLVAPPPRRVLVVHADTREEKMWPADRFVRVLDGFLHRHPDFIAFVVGVQSVGLDRGRYGHRVVSFIGVPLALSVALAGEADLFLGVDSVILHAADLGRIPGVALFGPSNCASWGFRFAPHRHVCGHRHDPADARMMETRPAASSEFLGFAQERRVFVWADGRMDRIEERAVSEALESVFGDAAAVV